MLRGLALLVCLLCGPVFAQSVDPARQILEDQAQARAREAAKTAQPGMELAPAALPTDQPQEDFCINIQEVKVEGVRLLPAAELAPLLEPYARNCVGAMGIDLLLQAITDAYIRAGYITSRAFIPEQDLSSGILTLVVVEGFVEAIAYRSIVGNTLDMEPKQRRVTAAFPVAVGDPLELRAIEQGVDNLNSVPSAQATLDIQPGPSLGGSILAITVAEEDRIRGQMSVNGWRNRAGSNGTYALSLQMDNMLQLNDQIGFNLSGGADDNALSATLSLPFDWARHDLSLTYSESLSPLTATTELFEQNVGFSYAVSRVIHRDATSKTRISFGLRSDANFREINGSALTPVRSLALRFGYGKERNAEGRFLAWEVGGSAIRVQGDAGWRLLLDADVQLYQGLGQGQTLLSTLRGQLANQPMPTAHQFSIGGNGLVRGFEGASVSGSSGISLSNEISFAGRWQAHCCAGPQTPNPFLAGLDPYLFADLGRVWTQGGLTSNRASAGFGLRLNHPKFSANMTLAVPLSKSGASQVDGPSLRFSLTPIRF